MIHDIKPRENQSSQKLIYLRYFETLSIPYSYQLKFLSTHNEKKTVKKTKTTINTLFLLYLRSIILESLFLNTYCPGPKTVKKQVVLIFYDFHRRFWLNLDLLTKVFPVIYSLTHSLTLPGQISSVIFFWLLI